MALDLSKLSPAPWANAIVRACCKLPHIPHGQGQCDYRVQSVDPDDHQVISCPPQIGDRHDGYTVVCGQYDYEDGGVVHQADAEFIALARNAFDVMMRRKWSVANIGQKWIVINAEPPFLRVRHTSHQGDFWAIEPFTALDEADKWMKEQETNHAGPPVC